MTRTWSHDQLVVWAAGRSPAHRPKTLKYPNPETTQKGQAFHGLPWRSMAVMAFHGLHGVPWPSWRSLAFHCLPFHSMTFHGLPWPSGEVPATAVGAQPCQVATLARPAVQLGISARCHSFQSNVNVLQPVELGATLPYTVGCK